MKQSRYIENRKFQILKEAESGVPVPELCRMCVPFIPLRRLTAAQATGSYHAA
jgi:hypothetical protein